jgi:hypothetical protein
VHSELSFLHISTSAFLVFRNDVFADLKVMPSEVSNRLCS